MRLHLTALVTTLLLAPGAVSAPAFAQATTGTVSGIVTDETKDHIASVGYDSNFGARPLARSIQNEIADPLAEMLLQGKFHAGDTVRIHPAEGKLVIEKTEAEERKPEPVAP